MNWEAVAAIGQLIGAAGVIVSRQRFRNLMKERT